MPSDFRDRVELKLSSTGTVPGKSRFIVANISFVLNYTKAKAAPPARAIEYEKSFPTLDAALRFCVQLSELGGEALYIIKMLGGVEDEVFEGEALVRSIKRQRTRQQAVTPPG
jgi:hypothetical protein